MFCFFLPLISSISFSPNKISPFPRALKKSSCEDISWYSHSLSTITEVISIECLLRYSERVVSPFFCSSRASRLRIAWIFAFAFAVQAKLIHEGNTCWELEVNISTWSPLFSLWLKGTNLWFTLAPIQWLPRNVCIWKAKSKAVHSAGIVLISPFGVNTNISEANRFNFIASRKSIASGWGSSRISFIVRNQLFSSPSSSVISPPFLYFQWAAKPCSATSSICSERIWTSIQRPWLLIRVTCKAW